MRHGLESSASYFWLDVVSINQHEARAVPRPSSWWADTFADAIRAFGALVVVATPWHAPRPLSRAWCLWEVRR